MMTSRLDITQIFWDVDDFCNQWSKLWQKQKQLPSMPSEKRCPKGFLKDTPSDIVPLWYNRFAYRSRMSLSEVMTIVIALIFLEEADAGVRKTNPKEARANNVLLSFTTKPHVYVLNC